MLDPQCRQKSVDKTVRFALLVGQFVRYHMLKVMEVKNLMKARKRSPKRCSLLNFFFFFFLFFEYNLRLWVITCWFLPLFDFLILKLMLFPHWEESLVNYLEKFRSRMIFSYMTFSNSKVCTVHHLCLYVELHCLVTLEHVLCFLTKW